MGGERIWSMNKVVKWILKKKKIIDLVGWILFLIFIFVAWKSGLITDSLALEKALKRAGGFAPLLFIFIQAVQVVVPVLPGAVGNVFGVIFFGPLWGFILNYLGICIGSVIAFHLSRKYGTNFAKQMTGRKFYNKYEKFLENERKFEKIFALLIFFPFAPDDFLCYLAGISKISYRKFTTIILLGKPLAIYLYTIGLTKVIFYATELAVKGGIF